MNDTISSVLSDLNPISTSFIVLIAVIWGTFAFKRNNSRILLVLPTILTSTGVFGTFLGIALGLSDFDTEDIKGSVPTLIDGLKTAFWSSIAGVFFAVITKFQYLSQPGNTQNRSSTIDDIVDSLNTINKALVGEEESTLLSQIKLMRQDSNDMLKELQSSMDNFLETMADNNSKALIAALEEVIRDFNAQINEQFGENFKQLNEAVGRMLEWQERYKLQMEEMIEQQKTAADTMVTATENYKTVVENTEKFSKAADDLLNLIKTLEGQKDTMLESTKQLAILINSAKDGLPQLEERITTLVSSVTSGVEEHSKAMTKVITDSATSMDNLFTESNNRFNQHLEDITDKTQEKITVLVSSVTSGVEQHSTAMTKAISDSTESMDRLFTESNNRYNQRLEEIAGKTQEQINILDQALSDELTKSLDALGQQLTALSGKFVEDYTPLVEKLQELLTLPERISDDR